MKTGDPCTVRMFNGRTPRNVNATVDKPGADMMTVLVNGRKILVDTASVTVR